MLLHDPCLADNANAAAAKATVAHPGTIIGGNGFDILSGALGEAGELPDQGADEDIVQIIYTSGTTGMPKGAALSHSALMAQYMSTVLGLEFNRNDRVLAALPLYHVA